MSFISTTARMLCVRARARSLAHLTHSIPGNVAVVIAIVVAMAMAMARNREPSNQPVSKPTSRMDEGKKTHIRKIVNWEAKTVHTQLQPMWKEISRIRLKIKHAYFYLYIGNEMNKIKGEKSPSQKQNEKCVSFVDVDLEYTWNMLHRFEGRKANEWTKEIAQRIPSEHGMAKMMTTKKNENDYDYDYDGWMGR